MQVLLWTVHLRARGAVFATRAFLLGTYYGNMQLRQPAGAHLSKPDQGTLVFCG